MGKNNEVEILVKAKDQTAGGIESARRNMRLLEREMSFGTQALIAAAKVKASIGAIELGFKSATSVVQLFKGDFDSFTDSIKKLPAGIGPAVSSLQSFLAEVTGIASATREAGAEIKRLEAETAKMFADETKRIAGRDAIEQINEKIHLIRTVDDFQRARDEAYLQWRRSKNVSGTQEETSAQFRLFEANLKKIADAQAEFRAKQAAEAAEVHADRIKQLQEESAKTQAIRQSGLAARFADQADRQNTLADIFAKPSVAELDRLAIENAINGVQRGGIPQLAGGGNQRFTSGLRESAQEKIASQAQRQTAIAEQQLKVLQETKKLLEDASKPGTQIDLSFASFGGLS